MNISTCAAADILGTFCFVCLKSAGEDCLSSCLTDLEGDSNTIL
jgi:hypothetical protein